MEDPFVDPDLARSIKDVKEKRKLLPAFLEARGLVKQHIESFDYFINTELKIIMKANDTLQWKSGSTAEFLWKYLDIWVGKPSVRQDGEEVKVSPHVCRLRDLTYSAPVYCKVQYRMSEKGPLREFNQLLVGRIPIMLRSSKCVLRGLNETQLEELKECPFDPGGYFIVKGIEKVILIQEQLSKNRIIIERDAKENLCASVTSSTHERKSRTVISQKQGRFVLQMQTIGDDIPVVVMMRAMGCLSDQEVVSMIGSELADLMAPSLEEAAALGIYSEEQALDYVGGKIKARRTVETEGKKRTLSKVEEARNVLEGTVLAHVPVERYNFRPKCIYVAHMIRRILLTQLGRIKLDDKDYYGNKRLELAGSLMALLFEDLFKRFNSDLLKEVEKALSSTASRAREYDARASAVSKEATITCGMQNAISTGNWVLKRFRMDRQGVTQQLSRLSYISALGHMTRVMSQFEKTRKVSGPRALQPSQWAMLCPSDTPEGESCGLVKNLALLSHVTTDEPPDKLRALAYTLGVEDAEMMSGEELNDQDAAAPAGGRPGEPYTVFLNGLILGLHRQPHLFAARMRALRRRCLVGAFVSVFVHEDHKAVHVASDGGRVCRPLIIVDPRTHRPKITAAHLRDLDLGLRDFHSLLAEGAVEYVDVNEENNTLVALRAEDIAPGSGHTHLEVDPMTILGVVTGLIPFPHHNQAARNTFQCAMGKQAMGTIARNQFERIDSVLFLLVHPMKPLVRTRVIDMIQFDSLPAGQNAIIAVMSYSGYDLEDALVLNRGSLDRGYGRCFVMRKHHLRISKHANNTWDRLAPPPPKHEFSGLEEDGLPMVGYKMMPGFVLVNRETPVSTTDTSVGGYVSKPLKLRSPEPCVVDRVLLTHPMDADSAEKNELIVKVLVRHTRRPELGDKFSSRHGQKGVVGLIARQEDMPFNDAGIVPDMIMNPHGFPSRMTVGKMIELIAGKAALMDGERRYGSAFGGDPVEQCSAALVRAGYHYAGKEFLTSGITGEPLRSYIFFGPIYYQKLKHMVLDKMHARARARANLTRQPTEGRSRDGGLRLGEMERDCLIGYGTAMLLQERLMISSDEFKADVCGSCGLLGSTGWCQYCRTGENMAVVRMPYAAKLLFQELISMNIVPRLRTQ